MFHFTSMIKYLRLICMGVYNILLLTMIVNVHTDLHQQKSDVIFLQETYSSAKKLKSWEAEWGGKMIGGHGTNHSQGVMTLFKPKLDVNIKQIISTKMGHTYLLKYW